MRRMKRLLAFALTSVMTLSLLVTPSFAMQVTRSGNQVTVTAEEGEQVIVATYDSGTGQMRSVEVLSAEEGAKYSGTYDLSGGTAFKAMAIDAKTYVPTGEAATGENEAIPVPDADYVVRTVKGVGGEPGHDELSTDGGKTWIENLHIEPDNTEERKSFNAPVTALFIGGSDGTLSFSKCDFNGGLTVYTEQDVSFGLDFCDNCSGEVTIVGTNDVRRGYDGQPFVFINSANGLTINANRRVSINNSGNPNFAECFTLNGLTFASGNNECSVDLNWQPSAWDADGNETAWDTLAILCNGEDYWYDDRGTTETTDDESNIGRIVTITGTVQPGKVLRVGGVVDVRGVTGGNLTLSGDKRAYVRLGGNKIVVSGNAGGEQFFETETNGVVRVDRNQNVWPVINGTQIGRANVHRWGDTYCIRVDRPYDEKYTYTVAWHGGFENAIDPKYYTVRADGDGTLIEPNTGEDGIRNVWPFMDENGDDDPYDLGLRIAYKGDGTNAGFDIRFNPLDVDWHRIVDVTEFGRELYRFLNKNGQASVAIVTEDDINAAKEIWASDVDDGYNFDGWDSVEMNGLALAVKYGGDFTYYNHPHDGIRLNTTAMTIVESVYDAIWNGKGGKVAFKDTGIGDGVGDRNNFDYCVERQDLDTLLDQLFAHLPQAEVEGEAYILTRAADGRETVNSDEDTTVSGKHFTQAVTVENGTDPADEDWGGSIRFVNCTFDQGVTVTPRERVDYEVVFENCGVVRITTTAGMTSGKRVQFRSDNKLTINDATVDPTAFLEESDNEDFLVEVFWNKQLNRGQFTQQLFEALGQPTENYEGFKFNDMNESDDYYTAVMTFAAMGVVNGDPDGNFDPNGPISRAQAAMILYRAKNQTANEGGWDNAPSDVSSDAWYYQAVRYVLESGIMDTCDGGNFLPDVNLEMGDIDWTKVGTGTVANNTPVYMLQVGTDAFYNEGGYRDNKPVTITGNVEGQLNVCGYVDVSGMTAQRIWQWYDDNHYNRRQSTITVGDKTLYVDGNAREDQYYNVSDGGRVVIKDANWQINPYINGLGIQTKAKEHDGDVWFDYYLRNTDGGNGIDKPDGFAVTAYLGTTPIGLTEDAKDENGWYAVTGDFNNDSIHNTSVEFTIDGAKLVFDPIPREWEYPVNIMDFMRDVLDMVREEFNQSYAVTENMELLKSYWSDKNDDWWSGFDGNNRALLSFAIAKGGIEKGDYNDPWDNIRYGTALNILTSVWQDIKGAGGLPGSVQLYIYDEEQKQNVPRSGEAMTWGLSCGEKDELIDRLKSALNNEYHVYTVEEAVAALSAGGRAYVSEDMILSPDALAGLFDADGETAYGNVLTKDVDDYILTVPAGAELRVCYDVNVAVGNGVTIKLADGTPVNADGAEVTTDALVWEENEWGAYVLCKRAELCVNDGMLTVNEGGAIVAGLWSNVSIDHDGALIVNGSLTLTGSDFHVRGYWTNGAFAQSDWDENRGDNGWVDVSAAAHLDNNGVLMIGTEEDRNGTLTLGRDTNLQNSWDGQSGDDPRAVIEIFGTTILKKDAYLNNDGVVRIASGAAVRLNGGGIGNNYDDRGTEDNTDDHSAQIVLAGTLTFGAEGWLNNDGAIETDGVLTLADGGSADIYSKTAFTLNGLTVTPGENGTWLWFGWEEGAFIVDQYDGDGAALSATDWTGTLYAYGDVDISGVTCAEGGAAYAKTAYVDKLEEMTAALTDPNVEDVIITDKIELTENLAAPAEKYLLIVEGASLTVPSEYTLTFEDGKAKDVATEPAQETIAGGLSSMKWGRRQGADNWTLRSTGGYLRIDEGGALTVDGTLTLGRYGYLLNNGDLSVAGTLTMKDATFFLAGEIGETYSLGADVGETGDAFIATDCATLINNGYAEISGSLTVGKDGYLQNGGELLAREGGTLTNSAGTIRSFGGLMVFGTLLNSGALVNYDWLHLIGMWSVGNGCVIDNYGHVIVYVAEGENDALTTPDVSKVITNKDKGKIAYSATVTTANGLLNAGEVDSCFTYCRVMEDVELEVAQETSLFISRLYINEGCTLTLSGPVKLEYDKLSLGGTSESDAGKIVTDSGATHGVRQNEQASSGDGE